MSSSALVQSKKWLLWLGILMLAILAILSNVQIVQSIGWQGFANFWMYGTFGALIIHLLTGEMGCVFVWRGLTRKQEWTQILKSEGALATYIFLLKPLILFSNLFKSAVIAFLVSASLSYSIPLTIGIVVGVASIYFLVDRLHKRVLEKARLGDEWYKPTK